MLIIVVNSNRYLKNKKPILRLRDLCFALQNKKKKNKNYINKTLLMQENPMKALQVGVAAFTKALKLTVKIRPLVGRIPLVCITCTHPELYTTQRFWFYLTKSNHCVPFGS